MEDYDKAIIYIDKLPEENEFLLFLGSKFEKYGLCGQEVKRWTLLNYIEKLIDKLVM